MLRKDCAKVIFFALYKQKSCVHRSGLSWKNHIDVGGGTIDQDFTGNVGVILFNHSDTDLKVSAGDRVAQLILVKIEIADVIEVDELEQTERGMGGFGSTGISHLKKAKTESTNPTVV